MSDEKQEMIADIVREMRNYAKRCREENFGVAPECEAHYNEDDVEYLADRIEAAWKRELAKVEADALSVGGIVEAARTAEKSSAVGNAAAMRGALDEIIEKIDEWRTDGLMEHWQYSQLFDIADAALSAPERNCDVYLTQPEMSRAYEEYRDAAMKRYGNGLTGRVPTVKQKPMTYDEWLLAPAAERKGEN